MGEPTTSGPPKVPASVLDTESTLIELKLTKEQLIKRLQQEWYHRELPIYTELQVRQMNSAV